MVLGTATIIGTAGAAVPAFLGAASTAAAGGAAVGTGATVAAATTTAVAAAPAATIISSAPAVVPAAAALGPAGWLVLGTAADGNNGVNGAYTWDCWKPVLRDASPEPSRGGMLLRDVVSDPRVRDVRAGDGGEGAPNFVVENVWGEVFRIDFVVLAGDGGRVAAHASRSKE